MSNDRPKRAVRKLRHDELRWLVECINHATTKPDHPLRDLLPRLIRGHHSVGPSNAERMIGATRNLDEDELLWIAENAERLAPAPHVRRRGNKLD